MWLDPDAAYYENLLLQPELTQETDRLVLSWDKEMHAGILIRFPRTPAARDFYGEVVRQMQASENIDGLPTTNDYVALTDCARDGLMPYTLLDDCKYRSGYYFDSPSYQARCRVRPVVQQHSWMVGAQTKIDFAKQHGMWFVDREKCLTRDLRVVVMTMNRPQSLHRLIESLKGAKYPPDMTVDLQVTADRDEQLNAHKETEEYLRSLTWERGFLEARVWSKHMGLLGQWMEAWPCEQYPASLYRAVILLEDDLELAPYYFEWFLGAHEVYGSERVGAVTGMRPALVAKEGSHPPMQELVPARVQAFAYRLMATWSLSPTYETWRLFRQWYRERPADFLPAVEGIVPWQWYQQFISQQRTDRMWEMWYIRFSDENNLYTVYPWVEGGSKTFVSNWKESGLNYRGGDGVDFPLFRDSALQNLRQSPLPFVEWDSSFKGTSRDQNL